MAKATKHPGRPQGARNFKAAEVVIEPSRCPECGSCCRDRYTQTRTKVWPCKLHKNGREYTRKVSRLTRCLTCGAYRREVSYEFHPQDVEAVKAPPVAV